ncbi:MAG: chromosome segregation protein SMC [Betaproteobacteria bacterium RIFCSPLOWO2_12_FULL_65_14]|nr:MAG: chromosome segregation protein SMC [Betaproteobacteria bacterium RIFCSPLOWO2_12_FULL_65_14]
MRLTQIKLSGFKSFVDPTAIHVPGQLVGVVGPNGCGKSNVIDAVRWVLGESRAAALRGDSMQDVIFNGSANRKPLARASVELIFDNSQGRAAGQWSQYAEISVRRVLQRDGESSYFINGTHVRRRDITDIFLGTGLGPRAYAIIEQGMISRVIEAKPEELRVFLEEAAGISKYKERRRETENRLADTRENLSRITDIRMELGAQLEKLEAQAKVATRYNELQSELQLKQHLLWYLRRRDAGNERERQAQEIGRVTNELEAENAELRGIESRVETARAAHYLAGDGLNAAQAALYAANAGVATHESELRHVEETRQRLESQHTERRAQLASWREQRSQLTQALHMWAARAGTAKQRVGETKRRLEDENNALPQAEQAFRGAQERLNEARSQLMRAESRLQLEQANLAHLERGRQALEQRRERLEGELRTLVEPDAGAVSGLEARIAELQAQVRAAEQASEARQSEVSSLDAEKAAAGEALNAAQREHAAVQAQIATLRQIQAAAEDNAPLREWFDRHGLGGLSPLWQKLRIDHGWETAVESVLRERLHALELTAPDALAAVLADRPPSKASVFERAAGEGVVSAQFETLAAKIHAADPAVAGALADWLAGVFIAEQAPSAEWRAALPPAGIFVTREGHQFTRHTVSLHAPDAADTGLLARQAEIEELEKRLEEMQAVLAAAQKDLDERDAQLVERNAALEGARLEISARQKAQHDAQIEHLKLMQAQDRYRERSAQVGAELEQVGAEMESGDAALADSRAAQERVIADIAVARERLEAARAAHVAAETTLADQRRAAQQAEREVQDALFGERECSSKISEIDNSVKVIDQQIERADLEVAKLNEELANDPIPAVREALDAAVEARISCEKTLGEARNAVEAAAAALRELEETRLQVESRVAPLRERVGELRLKEQAALLSFEQFDAQLREAGADEALLVAEAERAPRPSSLQGEITRITQAIGELGAVNLAALEELTTNQERKGYLDSQSADLDEAVHTLEDAIRRIDRETRELLRETFDSVNRHFGSLFPTLFGGGEAKLNMTGEEILDAGVQVMAHPPGKRNTSIQLLSGGEKALTAIALVFSLFQLNPAPFCLLDEVDAPLDDTNTQRFCDLVRRMSAHTQFLFISHNKISMEMAEQLVGVTMPESGVSRVVAVDIEEALRIREELAA